MRRRIPKSGKTYNQTETTNTTNIANCTVYALEKRPTLLYIERKNNPYLRYCLRHKLCKAVNLISETLKDDQPF